MGWVHKICLAPILTHTRLLGEISHLRARVPARAGNGRIILTADDVQGLRSVQQVVVIAYHMQRAGFCPISNSLRDRDKELISLAFRMSKRNKRGNGSTYAVVRLVDSL